MARKKNRIIGYLWKDGDCQTTDPYPAEEDEEIWNRLFRKFNLGSDLHIEYDKDTEELILNGKAKLVFISEEEK